MSKTSNTNKIFYTIWWIICAAIGMYIGDYLSENKEIEKLKIENLKLQNEILKHNLNATV